MGFRFRKSIKLLPGIGINLSKSGVITSVGVRGATVNFSDKGKFLEVGCNAHRSYRLFVLIDPHPMGGFECCHRHRR